ncbi:MAG: AsmA family protein, partial [Deltaproteobacteria bacterium]|nr:AsmA family protein [Deltaproteobacteria bacterium]
RLVVNGQLKVIKASYKTYKFWNLEAPLSYKNKHLKIDPLKFDLYDGKFKASTHIDFNKKDPLTQIETSLQGFNLEKFFASQKSKLSEKLTGTLEANLKLSLSGLAGEKIKRTIAGNGKAMVKKGYFKVFNLSEALAGIPVLSKIAPGFNISDDFEFLQSTLISKDQKLITPDILLKGQNHLLKCQGTFGFATAMDGSLDYKGSYYLSRTEDLRKQIPFTVGGTVSKPQASVDAGRLLQNSVTDIFEQILTPKGKTPPPEEEDPSATGQTPAPQDDTEPNSGNLIEDILGGGQEGTNP